MLFPVATVWDYTLVWFSNNKKAFLYSLLIKGGEKDCLKIKKKEQWNFYWADICYNSWARTRLSYGCYKGFHCA